MSVCKHCGANIVTDPDSVYGLGTHAEGVQRGLYRCAIEPYGFNAETVDEECGRTCNGSRGIEVVRILPLEGARNA